MDRMKIERAAELAKMSALQQSYKHRTSAECEVSKILLDTTNDKEEVEKHIKMSLAEQFAESIARSVYTSDKFKVATEHNRGDIPNDSVIKKHMEAYIFTKEELTQVFDDLIRAVAQELIKEGEHGTGTDNA